MATLYEYTNGFANCIQYDDDTFVNVETGELLDLEKLESLKMDRKEKIKNIALMIKNKRADAKMFKEEADSFLKREKSAKHSIEWLTNCLISNMEDGEKLKEKEVEIGWRNNPSIKINCKVSELPVQYQKYAEPTADKVGLRQAIKSGAKIEGVEIVVNKNIQIK